MKTSHKLLFATGISLLALMPAEAAVRNADAALATPPGITLQPLGKAQGYDLGKMSAASLPRDDIAYTDARGMTLYTYVKDQPGKSLCVGECAASWIPLAAPAKAQTFGDWSVITRGDGAKQWALKGRPLYTFVKDVDPGSVHGNSPARTGARRINGAGIPVGGGARGAGVRNAAPDVPLPPDWKVALLYPMTDMPLPVGIVVKEVPDAMGLVLVNHEGRTLYTFDGDAKRDKDSGVMWLPEPAPQLAEPLGDFAFVERPDGIKQWTFRGKPLYSYAKDLMAGDAYGIGVDKKRDVATVVRYFTPRGVAVDMTASQGKVLATTTGQTLYRRDGYIFQSGGGHSLRRGQPPRPAVGRDIGTNARCDAKCLQVWHPYKAPNDAVPQGFWSVGTRDDGSKQWMYQGYALWTYDGDKKPGDMNGHDTYEFAFTTEPAPAQAPDYGTPMDGLPGLNWAIAAP